MDTEQEKRQRKVRFHSRVQFKTIRHVANFSEDEIREGWYCKKDFMRMSNEVSEIAKLFAAGQKMYNGDELCTRGLEHLIEEDVADYRAEKMIASIDAVLDEQDEQMDENIYDPYTIAEVYSEIVAPLSREAYLVGLRDAKEGAAAAEAIEDFVNPPLLDAQEGATAAATAAAKKEVANPPLLQPSKARSQSKKWGNSSEHSEETHGLTIPVRRDSNNDMIEALSEIVQGLDAERDASDVEESETDQDGEENLNTSFQSMDGDHGPVAPEYFQKSKKKIINEPDKKKIDLKKGQAKTKDALKKKLVASKDKSGSNGEGGKGSSSPPTSPNRSNRRKAIDRKGGTELSPFVFRRDGTVGFRNFDAEHKKREQSRLRKESIKSSLFSVLDDDDDDKNFAKFLAEKKSKKPKESKLYAVQSRKAFLSSGSKKR
jgi:hypothetical protein